MVNKLSDNSNDSLLQLLMFAEPTLIEKKLGKSSWRKPDRTFLKIGVMGVSKFTNEASRNC